MNSTSTSEQKAIAYLEERFSHLPDPYCEDIVEAFKKRHDPDFYYQLEFDIEWEGEFELYLYDDDNNTDGALLWQGPSLLNGAPIAVVLTGIDKASHNRKTGPMIQSWIIHRDRVPTEAIRDGSDTAVCGNCPLRGNICYVNPITVNQVWHKLQDGGYSPLSPTQERIIIIRAKRLRLGSYGDPAAVPFETWKPLLDLSAAHTGYTHQWRVCDPRWKDYLMASVESEQDAKLAQAAGWRTFRILSPDAQLQPHEFLCTHEQDSAITCEMCGLCDGGDHKPNVAVHIHGSASKFKNFQTLQTPFNGVNHHGPYLELEAAR